MMNIINKHDLLQISHAYIHTCTLSNEFYITMNLLHLAWCDTFANTLFMNDIVHKLMAFCKLLCSLKNEHTHVAIARKLRNSVYIYIPYY